MELLPYVICAPSASRLLAIDSDCQDDPFYRYQTHQLVVALHGKRALLANLDLVAKDLQTSPDYVASYLATDLNATVKRAKQGGSATSTSWTLYPATFTLDKINASFRAFLTSFIMCPSCSLPELVNIVSEHKPATSPPRDSGPAPTSAVPKTGAKKALRSSQGGRVTVRCQSCGWNEPLKKSLKRVKNVKFVDYVLAHPPQHSSPALL